MAGNNEFVARKGLIVYGVNSGSTSDQVVVLNTATNKLETRTNAGTSGTSGSCLYGSDFCHIEIMGSDFSHVVTFTDNAKTNETIEALFGKKWTLDIIKGVKFCGANLLGCCFREASFSRANFYGCQLDGVSFFQTRLV